MLSARICSAPQQDTLYLNFVTPLSRGRQVYCIKCLILIND